MFLEKNPYQQRLVCEPSSADAAVMFSFLFLKKSHAQKHYLFWITELFFSMSMSLFFQCICNDKGNLVKKRTRLQRKDGT